MNTPYRHVKIVATAGPSCSDVNVLTQMILAGADAIRLNASHGKPAELIEWVKKVRTAQDMAGSITGILLDLPGPKLRVGTIDPNGVLLSPNDEVTFVPDGKIGGIPAGDWDLLQQVQVGEPILLVDGRIRLVALENTKSHILAKVVSGGTVYSRKGINLPGTTFDLPDLLPQDIAALDAVCADVDWVALSFVRNPSSADSLRTALKERGSQACIMAKIERPEAVRQANEIIEAYDGIMVARGDLGVELKLEEVPQIQRTLVNASQLSGKACIIATEMLETMIQEYRPTRAEAGDVANAVWQYTDSVMLSGETAMGKHPVHVIETMVRIILDAERELNTEMFLRRQKPKLNTEEAIARGAALIAFDVQADAIVTPTLTGSTSRRVERYRPRTRIIATSPNQAILQQLSIYAGIRGLMIPENSHPVESSLAVLPNHYGLKSGDRVVITGGWPPGSKGVTNFVQVRILP